MLRVTKKRLLIFACSIIVIAIMVRSGSEMTYQMSFEDVKHEGTWLAWPHKYTYGASYQKELEDIWIEMCLALFPGEKVHIIAYNEVEKKHIIGLLKANKINLKQIDFVLAKTNDVWVRDYGPLFVHDQNQKLVIANFGFDGWGKKMEYSNDNALNSKISHAIGIATIELKDFILEGGSIEVDGAGSLMATRSSIFEKRRNPNLTQKQAEQYLNKYLGITNFIWLDGVKGEDITDAHIDGIARFINNQKILCVAQSDFDKLYENISNHDFEIISQARNAQSRSYEIVEMPLTKEFVSGLEYYGSYMNYYVGNEVVLFPIYNDENDQNAINLIAKLYPDKEIKPIEIVNLYKYGGMIHCVSKQQPAK